MENTSAQVLINRPFRPFPVIFLIIALILLAAITYFYFSKQNYKPSLLTSTKDKSAQSTNSYQEVEGLVEKIDRNLLTIRENILSKVEITTTDQTSIYIETINIPSQKTSSNSAQLLYTLISSQGGAYSNIKPGDRVKIALEQKNNQYQAKTITIVREQNK